MYTVYNKRLNVPIQVYFKLLSKLVSKTQVANMQVANTCSY